MRLPNTLTKEEMERLGVDFQSVEELPSTSRGWTKADFKSAFAKKQMTYSAFERLVHLAPGSVNQSLNKRFPKSDKLIAAYLDVPLHQLWPNRYTVTGVIWPRNITPESLTDEQLAKLNEKYAVNMQHGQKRRVITLEDQFRQRQQASLPPGIGD